jgi:hypothetical protein
LKAPRRLLLCVLSAATLAVSLAVSVGAPSVRGVGPLPSTGLPFPTVRLPVPTVSLPLPTIRLPLPTVSLPLPTVSLPLPSVSPPLPTAPSASGTPRPTDESASAGSAGPSSSVGDGAAGGGSQRSGPQAPGDATQAGLQVPGVVVVPPSLPNVGTWLVPSLGVAVPALLVAVLVLVQVLSGAAGIRATRGVLDRVGTHVPPLLRRTDASGEGTRPR